MVVLEQPRAFWIQREHLLQALRDVGFDVPMEQFGHLEPNVAESLLGGFYLANLRGMFIGVKMGNVTNAAGAPVA